MPFLPFIPFVDCAEAVFRFTQQTSIWFLTMGFKFNSAISLSDLVSLFGGLDSWWTAQLSTRVSAGATLNDIKISDLTTAVGPVYVAPPSTQAIGQLSGAVLPAQAAMVVSLATAKRGRAFRGRNYVAGRVSPEQATITDWTSGSVLAMDVVYNALSTYVGPLNWTHVVLSRQLNSVRRTIGEANAVTSYQAKVKMATQRKRLL